MKYTHDIGKTKQNRLMHFQIGLIIALFAALVCVNYSMDIYVNEGSGIEDIPEDITVTPNTKWENKQTPPPVVEAVDPEKVVKDILFDLEPDPEPQAKPINNPNPVATTKPIRTKPTAPKPKEQTIVNENPPVIIPPTPPAPKGGIEVIVEKMPVFKVPKDKKASEDEIKKYADQELIKYVMKRVKYPSLAKENGITGIVVVRFVVEKDGSLTKSEILRDPGFGMGNEVLRVINNMPKWERVGRQNGRSVRVYFTMPIRFELEK